MTTPEAKLPIAYRELQSYWGDIHNHCDVSYGHGSLDDAIENARTQLDFTSVTAHAHWPDLPADDPRLAGVNAYHREGFDRARRTWPRYREANNAANHDGEFTTFLSFEWHSLQSGDHNVYFNGDEGEILTADTLEGLRARLRGLAHHGTAAFLIPHHIGYRQGYRGINWQEFTPEFSPFVEIFSMHGASESDDAPYPYLHTMGPLDSRSTMQHGLALGHVFGVVGSTDSHSAHPGSYGHGRLGTWATGLNRDAIWNAMQARRTVALTGDNIEVAFAINDQPIGSIIPFDTEREIEIVVEAGDTLDYVELIHNNTVLKRWDVTGGAGIVPSEDKVHLELGWGEGLAFVDWEVDLAVSGGRLLDVEPRFRGEDIVSPRSDIADEFQFSRINTLTPHHISFSTRSWPNPSSGSPGTQGMSLHLEGTSTTMIAGTINDHHVEMTLGDLRTGSRAGYLGGFLTPAYRFHRAAPYSAFRLFETFSHRCSGEHDAYYVRVRQRNNQWAWTSPIWIRRFDPNTATAPAR